MGGKYRLCKIYQQLVRRWVKHLPQSFDKFFISDSRKKYFASLSNFSLRATLDGSAVILL